MMVVRKPTSTPLVGWSWVAFSLALVELVLALSMAVAGNSEGWAGAVLYALMYALPALLVGLALTSHRLLPHRIAGWAALLLALIYAAIIAGNWSGYTNRTMFLALVATAPAVAVYIVIFWAAALRHPAP